MAKGILLLLFATAQKVTKNAAAAEKKLKINLDLP
jgi:hypothetical protein